MASPKHISEGKNDQHHSNELSDTDTAALLPHLESFEKMLKLPFVEAAWNQSQDVYGRVKGKKFEF